MCVCVSRVWCLCACIPVVYCFGYDWGDDEGRELNGIIVEAELKSG